MAQVMKQVKGASSYWINLQQNFETPFEWQEGYGTFSVDTINKDLIWNYIKNQKRHHKLNTTNNAWEIGEWSEIPNDYHEI